MFNAKAATVPASASIPEAQPIHQRLSEALDTGRIELPLLPGVAAEILSEASRDTVDPRSLAELLRRDPAVSAHVLRVANSPLYSPRTQIVSVQQAISRLGVSKIKEIALAVTCKAGVFKANHFQTELDRVFLHSVTTALIAQEIARQTRRNVEEAFLCGLLHDVGRPILLTLLSSFVPKQAVPEAGLQAVTALHSRAGGALTRAWALPESVGSVAMHHHELEPPHLHEGAVRIIQLADELAHQALESEYQPTEPTRQSTAIQCLEVYPDMLERVSTAIPKIIELSRGMG